MNCVSVCVEIVKSKKKTIEVDNIFEKTHFPSDLKLFSVAQKLVRK